MKKRPDFILILLALFGLGVLATLLLPFSFSQPVVDSGAATRAGLIVQAEPDGS